jgi:hypothetical protein
MHFRTIRKGDLDACAALLPRSTAPALTPGALVALWRELLREERITGGVVVEPPSDRVLAFGLTTFVEDAFLTSYLEAPTPNLAACLYEGVRSQPSLMLDPPDVRRANQAAALNFVILHFRLLPDLDPQVAQGVVAAAEAGFRLAHGGHRVRRMLQEAHDEYEARMLAGAGLRVKCERPTLMGLFADDAESRTPGTAAASLFQWGEPRFHFSPGEQRVLSRAVLDESDDEIAEEIGLSLAAVKKVWRRAYERVADVAPTLLDTDGDGASATRGKEKRRNLIRYLRYHLYELRPLARRGGQ